MEIVNLLLWLFLGSNLDGSASHEVAYLSGNNYLTTACTESVSI